jgi:hypothetical protein
VRYGGVGERKLAKGAAMKDLQARIATFLRGKPGGLYCDDCIREEFPDATIEDVGRETESMHGQIGFLKIPDICTRCGQQKSVTRAM